jgi:hypothetical protein
MRPGSNVHAIADQLLRLLRAVRRRLWWLEAVASARQALWGSAALLPAAAALRLWGYALDAGIIATALALWWAVIMTRAAAKRPPDATCARWADQHLGGASAFGTWLELHDPARRAAASHQACRWLEGWAGSRVPPALELLARRKEPLQLAKPAAFAAVAALLTAALLPLQPIAPSASNPAVAEPPRPERIAAEAEPPPSARLSDEVAAALRAREAEPPRAASGTAAPAAVPGEPSGQRVDAVAAKGEGGRRPSGRVDAGAGAAAGASPGVAGGSEAASGGTGRDAGSARDQRAAQGSSRALAAALPTRAAATRLRDATAAGRADAAVAAEYDDRPSWAGPSGAAAVGAAAAAFPPPAADEVHLSPTETRYVDAWMKARIR